MTAPGATVAPKDWPKGKPYAVRLKAPHEGETSVADRVQGHVTWANKDLDDMVLLRSDGTPTYMLAVVVDDHDMGITHIIRGDDHLTNAARQTQLYHAMGWHVPSFAHIPLIHGPDGAKLSKRHGALGAEAYRAMGYLPDAMRNYLARLGWSHGDDEIFSTEQAIEWFDLNAIGRSPSRFDFAKLENLNGIYIRNTPDAELVAQIEAIAPEIEAAKEFSGSITKAGWGKLKKAMPGLKERAKTLVELLVSARYLFVKRPIDIDEKAAKHLEGDGLKHLAALHERFSALDDWEPGRARSRDARLCRRGRRQARRRRPALARRADGPHHLAAHLRRAACAGPQGEPCAHRGSGGHWQVANPASSRGGLGRRGRAETGAGLAPSGLLRGFY